MIPEAFITDWARGAPWPTPLQVEQDLILSRLMIEIAEHDFLSSSLAFRGGTCLHKLYLPHAYRYSEDLDYVRSDDGAKMGEIFDALREITGEVGLSEGKRKFPSRHSDMGTIWFDTEATDGGRIRIKIESNVAETAPYGKHALLDYKVESSWWSGETEIRTFDLEELLSTKVRALCQRRKGRDLFDLWLALRELDPDREKVIAALNHYMGDGVYSYPQLRMILKKKLTDGTFLADLGLLVVEVPEDYAPEQALDLVLAELGILLRNAPAEHESIIAA